MTAYLPPSVSIPALSFSIKSPRLGVVCAGLIFLLTGCGTWFGKKEAPPLSGVREQVLRSGQRLAASAALSGAPIQLPKAYRNAAWPGYGGAPSHAMQHLRLAPVIKRVWRTDIGDGSDGTLQQLATPVIADGRLYVMDANSQVSALDTKTGRILWRRDLVPEAESSGAHSGGLAIAGGRLVAATGYGEVIAMTAANGKLAWRRKIGPPIRSAPTIERGRVIVISHDNRAYALDLRSGKTLWRHQGEVISASLVGGASAAAGGGMVIVPYSNGEIYGLSLENGRELWGDALVKARSLTPLTSLAEIRGAPVFDRDMVIAIGHGGTMVALDMRKRRRLWTKAIGGTEMPWVAGNYIFVLNSKNELICLTRDRGQVRWIVQLDRFRDPEDAEGPITWSGPVLASDRLYLTSDAGGIVTVSPLSGKILDRIALPAGSSVPPVVAAGTIYFLTDDGVVVAYR